MMTRFLIDIGSSTVKMYERQDKQVILIEQKTFHFKEGFSPDYGLCTEVLNDLLTYFKSLIHKYTLTNRNTKLYATGVFRKLTTPKSFVELFYKQTGLYFNIITHDLEAFYLEKAWVNEKSAQVNNMIVINIGGETTELLYCHNGVVTAPPQKLSIGVGSVKNQFPNINKRFSEYSLDNIVKVLMEDIRGEIGKNIENFNVAIYTGGELNYMKSAGYHLISNTIFNDLMHPSMIDINDYKKRNSEVFSCIEINKLKSMMPNNPEWMTGARACSALAQAICQCFNVKYIVPSDSNLIDGVNVQEAQSVVICGSFNKHLTQIAKLITKLTDNGIEVLSPRSTEIIDIEGDFVVFKNDIIKNHNTWAIEELHLKAIDKCDFVIACNFDNYLGVSTTFELEHAYRLGKKIVFIEDNAMADNFGDRIGVRNMPCEIGLLK